LATSGDTEGIFFDAAVNCDSSNHVSALEIGELPTELHPLRMVDIEYVNRGPTTRRQTEKHKPPPLKMALPALAPGIAETNNPTREGITAGQIWTLSEVAAVATPSAILRRINAAMLLGENVLDVERCKRNRRVWNVAVFAPLTGTFADELTKKALHQAVGERFKKARALAWRMEMKSIAAT
jgi:hypothetical protein